MALKLTQKWVLGIWTLACLFFLIGGCTSPKQETTSNSTETNLVPNNGTTNENHLGQQKQNNDLFNNPQKLCSILSEVGIGQLYEWKPDEISGWYSITDRYMIEPINERITLGNNMFYLLEGNETNVRQIVIYVNINVSSEKKSTIKFLREVTTKTFKAINIQLPKELIQAITDSKSYNTSIKEFDLSVLYEKDRIENFEVKIKKR